ncbi:MAG: sigma-54-dependent transcriptional regulator [Spirochaetota bacterium]
MVRFPEGRYSILIVDDEEGIRHGLTNFFRREGFTTYEAPSFESAVSITEKKSLDVALIDIRLKNEKNGIDLLRRLKSIDPELVQIIITGYGSIDTAVTSIKEGASDYILKPIDNKKLLDVVNKNLEIRSLKNKNYYLKKELINRSVPPCFITNNDEMKKLINHADRIKNSPVTILISGESGTGKEVLARYIHFTSNRSEAEFVSINCASLSENLLLSELFGHEKGAFTGAIERQIGKFEIADRGTLFLDEIGDMSPDIQAKLLRVIEESSFERVGGTSRIHVDVRIIAATNRDLTKLMNEGRFREDLYYRIKVVSFHLSPLRNRKEDIPLLVDHFVKKYNVKYNKRVPGFSEEAMQILMGYDWSGNVRELENVVNQAVLLSEDEMIEAKDLRKALFYGEEKEEPQFDISNITSFKKAMLNIVESYEKKIIEHFLVKNNFNKSKTARDLAITRRTLANKIERYNLKP